MSILGGFAAVLLCRLRNDIRFVCTCIIYFYCIYTAYVASPTSLSPPFLRTYLCVYVSLSLMSCAFCRVLSPAVRVQAAAYSCQSDKLINSGEGGFLTTNDEELFSRAIYMSGCYEMRYGKRTRTTRHRSICRRTTVVHLPAAEHYEVTRD